MLLGSLGWEEAGLGWRGVLTWLSYSFCTVSDCLKLGAENFKYSLTTVMSRYQK